MSGTGRIIPVKRAELCFDLDGWYFLSGVDARAVTYESSPFFFKHLIRLNE